MSGRWQRVAARADLSDDAALPVKLGDTPIALYLLDGEVHAIDDVCTHEFALLSQGFIDGGAIECPLHQARFCIATGRCLAPPATVDLRTYVVRVEGEDILVRASE
jgi:nitrite reductase/ring-hydroxylating ferredoxin subunit